MKKFAKLSLIAAVAVAGISTANAQDLSEAIKGVDVSGSIVYRYNDYENKANANNAATNAYKMAVSVKAPVNDDVAVNTRFLATNDAAKGDATYLGTSSDADSNVDVRLSEVNFTYTGIENATVTVGKQGVATPFTVHRDGMGGESTGTGILATYAMGPVTAAGAYFNQTNIAGAVNLATVGLMGTFAGINADAWFLDADDNYDIYTLGLSASYEVGGVQLSPSVRYSSQDYDGNNDDAELLKAEMGLAVGIFDAYLGYAKTGDDLGVNTDGNSSAIVMDPHWRVGLFNQKDADAIFANVGVQVTDTVHLSARYSDVDADGTANDVSETYAQVVYQMSSNFYTMVRFGEYEQEGQDDATSGRLQIGYSF